MTHQHQFPISDLDSHAVGIVKALQKQGHTSYLVGGCVRDLLVGLKPKDFDIGTTASPEQIRRIIYRSYVIGKRFRLVLVKRDDQQYEVATFRREVSADDIKAMEAEETEVPRGDNFFGTPEEDARRRDFTINALFYDPVEHILIDYCQGLTDLEDRLIRIIGEPVVRLKEDPIRILRGVRLAHKLGFSIEPSLRSAMIETASTLKTTVLPRRREEFLKLLRLDDPSLAFLELYDLGILEATAPSLVPIFADLERQKLFLHYLRQFHERPLDLASPLELFGTLLLAVLRALYEDHRGREILDQPEMVRLMRDELGMFKYEQSLFAKALQLHSLMKRKREFEKRGPRRRQAVVQTDAFKVALQLAERDYWLSADELMFWRDEAQKTAEMGPLTSDDFKEDRGPRRRRRRRRPAGRSHRSTDSNASPKD